MISFSHPTWLLLLPLLLYFTWKIQKESFTGAGAIRRWIWIVIRAVVLLLVILALAGLQWKTEVRRKQVIFLVDLSDSILPDQRDQARLWMNDAIRKIHPPDQAGVVLFGSEAQVERFPASPVPVARFESQVDGSATSFENALRLAEALFAANYQKNLILLSDGLENSGNAELLARTFPKKGIYLQAVHLQGAEKPEANLETIRLPEEIRIREPFSLEIVAASNRKMPAIVQVFRNGNLLQEGSLSLRPDQKYFVRLPQTIEKPGLYRYEVRLKPFEDFRTENNLLESWVLVQGPPRILLIDQQPKDLKTLAATLQKHAFEVDLRGPSYFPRSIQEMLLYQSILIRNVSASEIHDQMPLIRSYVRDFGGGFGMLGGRKSFGPGGYYNTPVEETLPVRMDLVNKKYLADVAMVLVIDKSGSMSFADRGRQKIDLADEGGARVASLLKKTDRLGVIAVDSVPKWAHELQNLTNPQAAIDAITSIRAGGGGIYVYSGLREAYSALSSIKSTVKHVILFADTADCEEKDGPNGESSFTLAQRAFDQNQITTTTIGIGQPGDPDVSFLKQVATIGQGRFYFTNDMFTLPEIFTEESSIVQRYYITEETFLPKVAIREPLLLGLETIPELQGYVATTLKPQAGASLLSHRDDPVLAFWRFGIGQAVAFTSDPGVEWSPQWPGWPGFERFCSQIARYLARSQQPPQFRTGFHVEGNRTTIVVESFEPAGETRGTYEAVLIDRNGRTNSVVLENTAPGRYQASLPGRGSLFGKIYHLNQKEVLEEAIVQSPGSLNQEYQPGRSGETFLSTISGRVVRNPSDLQFPNHATVDLEPLRNSLLLFAAILFLLDVAARKIDLRQFFSSQHQTIPEVASVSGPLAQLKVRKLDIKHQPRYEMELEPDAKVKTVEPVAIQPEAEKKPAETSEYLQRLKDAKRRGS